MGYVREDVKMVQGFLVFLLLLLSYIQIYPVEAITDTVDTTALNGLKNAWQNTPPGWVGSDPCGSNWDGIMCNGSHVTSITLSSMRLEGQVTEDIVSFSELQILDLSYNQGLRGTIPATIGNLKKLRNLILVGCSFSGTIPDSIGDLPKLNFLSLNSNGFTGKIPASIGKLSNLYWLDLSNNQLEGSIPVSTGDVPGLDLLVTTRHFHFSKNQLSGPIPSKLFSSGMELIHMLFDSNNLNGSIPSTLGLVQNLELVRFDGNSLTGPVPLNLSSLTNVSELYLSNNNLTGPIPNLTSMVSLSYLDLSNNSFDATDLPTWLSTLQNLTTIMMEHTQLQGQVPVGLFSRPSLQTVLLKNNNLNGTLYLGPSFSTQLLVVDLQNNNFSGYGQIPSGDNVDVRLAGNPVCEETGLTETYCISCAQPICGVNQVSSPNCQCAYPYTGVLVFRAVSSKNATAYVSLKAALSDAFKSRQIPIDSISLSNPSEDSVGYLRLNLSVFPSGDIAFNQTMILSIGLVLSNGTFKPPNDFGPYYFIGDTYLFSSESSSSRKPSITNSSSSSTGIIIGPVVGGVLLLLLAFAGIYVYYQKKKTEREQIKPFVKGVRHFSFDDLKKCTNNFSNAHDIGSGGYGKVYRGMLPSGEIIAIKRAKQESMQGALEFKTEIELLSRVHHKNVVILLGFCLERGEQILIYEFVPNGNLKDILSGKTGIRLDWIMRLKVVLGAARGLAYLHELANPPIIHRDIKSNNILLDERLNAKVADFGLSVPLGDIEKGHVTTQVKGTMGYLDPEYYMTQHLTEKSDVYSFGVLMLELLTGRTPIERGKYIVREIRIVLDRTKDLYNLHELLDPFICSDLTLQGFNKYVDLAMKCVEDSRADRPTMGELVKELENILQLIGLNPTADSSTTLTSNGDVNNGVLVDPYAKEAFDYSNKYTFSEIEPQ